MTPHNATPTESEPDSRQKVLSDKDMLEALNLSENEAAKILGRSRQSLYQARLAGRSDYFRKADIRSLVFEARGQDRDIDLTAVLSYIANTRGSDVANAIRAVSAQAAGDIDMSAYRELWVVVPDAAWMSHTHPESMKQVVRYGALPGIQVRYFTSCPLDSMSLTALLRTEAVSEPDVKCQTWIGAIPPMIIADPQQSAHIFLFNAGTFTRNDWYGGRNLVMLIQGLVDDRLRMDDSPVPLPTRAPTTPDRLRARRFPRAVSR